MFHKRVNYNINEHYTHKEKGLNFCTPNCQTSGTFTGENLHLMGYQAEIFTLV